MSLYKTDDGNLIFFLYNNMPSCDAYIHVVFIGGHVKQKRHLYYYLVMLYRDDHTVSHIVIITCYNVCSHITYIIFLFICVLSFAGFPIRPRILRIGERWLCRSSTTTQ